MYYVLPVSFFSLLRVVLCLAPREGESEEGPGGGLASGSGVTRPEAPWVTSGDTRDLASGLALTSPEPRDSASTLSQEVITLFSFSAGPGAGPEVRRECFSGLQIVLEAVVDSTSSQSYCPVRGRPESKSKFHRLEASLRAFFSSFLTNRRFSSWSVGPNRARLTLLAPVLAEGGLSSSELLWDVRLMLEWRPNILWPLEVKDWCWFQVPVTILRLNFRTQVDKSTDELTWNSSVLYVLSICSDRQMSK